MIRCARRLAALSFAGVAGLALVSCGGGSSMPSSGALAGNWQFVLNRTFPLPKTPVPVSGFLTQTANNLVGSVQVTPNSQNGRCGGVGDLAGSLDGQTVNISINQGGTTLNLIGTLGSDNKSMSGSYSGLNGGCYTSPTSGTWTATLVPPISGSFSGTLTSSLYMGFLTGQNPPAPINVSGSFTQVGGTGSSNATVTGTITADNYPCFRSASLSGTISGENVYLLVYGFDGSQIGNIGIPPSAPASFQATPTGLTLVGSSPGTSGLALGGTSATGSFGPCPSLQTTQGTINYDQAALTLNFQ